jgi:hypothetical protein
MFIPDPDPDLSIPDLTTTTKDEGGNICPTFFVATNYTKLEIFLFLTWWV